MPSRIIKETIIISESLSNISADAERFFWRLIVKADDFGLFYGDPRILASLCFPQKPPTEQRVRSWLTELVGEGMVGTYTGDDGKKYLKLLNWEKCQQTRAKNSKYPLPSTFDITCNQVNGNQMKANVPVNDNDNEFENRETKTKTAPAAAAPDGFVRFWTSYPKKVGKQDALKAWAKLNPDPDTVDAIVAGVERWKNCEQWTKDGGKFVCWPQKFLNGRLWEDDPGAPVGPNRDGPKNYDGDEDFLGR
jgi:hypothetical protein